MTWPDDFVTFLAYTRQSDALNLNTYILWKINDYIEVRPTVK